MLNIDRGKFEVHDYIGDNSQELFELGIVPNSGEAICLTTEATKYVLVAGPETKFSLLQLDDATNYDDTYESTAADGSELEEDMHKLRRVVLSQAPAFIACISNLMHTTAAKPTSLDLWLPLQQNQLVSVSERVDGIILPTTYLSGALIDASLVVHRNEERN